MANAGPNTNGSQFRAPLKQTGWMASMSYLEMSRRAWMSSKSRILRFPKWSNVGKNYRCRLWTTSVNYPDDAQKLNIQVLSQYDMQVSHFQYHIIVRRSSLPTTKV